MDDFRRRCALAKQADDSRHTLLTDMLQKLDDMHKTMDRNSFIFVLIDGDCMNFHDDLVKQGAIGGEAAAKLLRRAVFNYLRYDEDFKHDHRIVIRVYASLRSLSKSYMAKGILQNLTTLSDFVLGFNEAHPLCDFIDAGNRKEAVDTKIREILNLHVYNVHCKHVVFGASADNGHASFLNSSFADTDVVSRISLIRGPPFAFEFRNIMTQFRWTEFKDVFRSDLSSSASPPIPSDNQETKRVPNHNRLLLEKENIKWSHKKEAESSTAGGTDQKRPSSDLIEFPEAEEGEVSDIDLEDPHATTTEIDQDYLSTLAAASSGHSTPPHTDGDSSVADKIEAALILCTNEILKVSPKALDFGAVKQRVEEKLGLPPGLWESYDDDIDSKTIIKMAVEDWVERTNNPPPKNATWMLRHFRDEEESPASIMRSPASITWRTKKKSPVSSTKKFDRNPSPNEGEGENVTEKRRQLSWRRPQSPKNNPDHISRGSSRKISTSVAQNSAGQRLDIPIDLNANPSHVSALRSRVPRLCNAHYLLGDCTNKTCEYEHDYTLKDGEFLALLFICRGLVCSQGSACTYEKCIKGHMCPNGNSCRRGSDCRFSAMHGIDTVVAQQESEAVGVW